LMNIKNYSILMNGFSKKEKKEFLLKFFSSSSVLSLGNVFSETIGEKVKSIYFDAECNPLRYNKRERQCIVNFLKEIKSAPIQKIHIFKCLCNKICLVIPVVQGDNLYGYIFSLHLDRRPEKKDIVFMKLFIALSLKEFQKEQELTKLYDTIRPRAIALSTIHTIHRLLSSTLDMNELIERIARLTLQVMRAKHCFIMLLDDTRHYLIPKSFISLENNIGRSSKRHRKIKIGNTGVGKVAKTGKTILSRNSICLPLVEEDIVGVLCAKNKINNTPFNRFDIEILLTLAEQAVIAIKNAQLYEEQEKRAYGSIKSLAALLDAKSPHTYTHSEQFVKIVLAIAEEMR